MINPYRPNQTDLRNAWFQGRASAGMTDPKGECEACGKLAHFHCINEDCERAVGDFLSGYNAGHRAARETP